MASDYGLNFGFRRSDESMATREGRFKTPASGSALLQGSAVELDPASAGYLKQSASGADAVVGLRGLLVQEESHLGSVFSAAPYLGHDSIDLGSCKLDQLSVMWAGAGTKVWFKNTPAYSRYGRTKGAVTIVDLTTGTPAVGDALGWDGSKWVKDADAVDQWMTITHISGTTYCEAVLKF